MFSYYGSKQRIVNFYPPPKYTKIIEPFAGGAAYSLKYFDREVLLMDKYEVVVKIWKWLQKCSRDDVLKLPRLKEGERLSNYKFDCEEARLMMGFVIAKGSLSPRDKASKLATTHRPNNINFTLNKIANNLEKIRHWEIVFGDYAELPNQQATWFIDPPYIKGGEHYPRGSRDIDYCSLAAWCKERMGQVIVCENSEANWLPFAPFTKTYGVHRTMTEGIWTNTPQARQLELA